MRKHYLIQPVWACQNRCSYCWVRSTVGQRAELYHAPTRQMAEWAQAIHRDKPTIVDIAGGEPLLLSWLPDLIACCPETKFGLSTNGLDIAGVARLAERQLSNVVSINVSYHPESAERWPWYVQRWRAAVLMLNSAGYTLASNLIDTGDNVAKSAPVLAWLAEQGVPAVVSPCEETGDLGERLEQGLCCQGGVQHLVMAPDGSAWPCLTALRSPYWRDLRLGNWLDNTVDLSRKPQPCHLQCTDYYVLAKEHSSGDMWWTEATPCQ